MNDLTNQDLWVLMEALEAWENKDDSSEMIGVLLDSIVVPKFENRERLKKQIEEKQAKLAAAKRERKERSVMLRAKLITIRDGRAAAALSESTIGATN